MRITTVTGPSLPRATAAEPSALLIKKRAGPHEKSIREYEIGSGGLSVGPALHQFQGVLRGVPDFVGSEAGLLGEQAE